MSLLVLGLSHHTAPVTLRERFAFPDAELPAILAALRRSGVADEAVILSTCNRVELYAVSSLEPRRAFAELHDFLLQSRDYREPLTDELYRFKDLQGVEHLFRVACGLDSMVLGETEILGQLKKAYDLALQHSHTGPRLNKLFQKAFNVAKHVRTETSIQRGSISVASVAVELAERIFSSLDGRQVMVLGAGDTSEKAARALLSRGAHSIIISNRSYDRAEVLAQELNGRAVHFEQWDREFRHVDIVISSTAAPHHILDRTKLEPIMHLRNNAPLLLIDIAVPRDIEPEVNFLDNVYLYNVDDLQAIADGYLRQRQEEIARCNAIIAEKARSWLGTPPPGRAHGSDPLLGQE